MTTQIYVSSDPKGFPGSTCFRIVYAITELSNGIRISTLTKLDDHSFFMHGFATDAHKIASMQGFHFVTCKLKFAAFNCCFSIEGKVS